MELEVREHHHQVGLGLRIIFMYYYMSIWGLAGVVDGGCLLQVIGSSCIDQGGVGGPGTSPSGRAWSENHFYV